FIGTLNHIRRNTTTLKLALMGLLPATSDVLCILNAATVNLIGGFTSSVNIFIKIMPTHSIKQKVLQIKKERNVQICCFPYLLTLI
ncbi:hypothetical protein P2Q56_18960, partial [Escherichia coli]